MRHDVHGSRGKAVELLELHDDLDRLDEEFRVQKTVLRLTPLIAIVLAVPLLVVLFLHEVRYFAVYPATFVLVLGAILYALTKERRRRAEDRKAVRSRIEQIERAP